jgi:hypothetical protein
MDMLFMERMDERLNELDSTTNIADQHTRMRQLQTIFINTHFKFEEKTVTDLKTKFKSVKAKLKTHTPTMGKAAMAQHQAVVVSVVEEELDELHFKIVSLLFEHNIIHLKTRPRLSPEEEYAREYM